jgi:hypothetical protein
LCVLVHKAHGHCDCCQAMHACACLCVLVHKAHAHCDCCQAMHVCVGICVLVCTRRMVTVIAARQCMFVSNNWPECLISMLAHVCAQARPCLLS